MRRITFHVDCENEEVDKVQKSIESLQHSLGLHVTVIGIEELISNSE